MKKTVLITVALLSFMLNLLCLNAQWEKTNFPQDAAFVTSFAISGNNIFAGTYTGGVLLSTDNGESWINKGLIYDGIRINTLKIFGNTVFVGCSWGEYGGTVFISKNNGDNWTRADSGMEPLQGENPPVYDFEEFGNNIFAATGRGIFQSSNNGTNWIPKFDIYNDTIVGFASLATKGSYLFAAGTDGGVFLSTDGGNNWIEKNNGLTNHYVRSLAINGEQIFAGAGGVFLSTDNGNSWTEKNIELVHTSFNVTSMAICGNYIFAGLLFGLSIGSTGGVILSTNNGDDWKDVSFDIYFNSWSVEALVVKGDYIFASTPGYDAYDHIFRAKISDLITTSVDEEKHSEFALSIAPNPINDITSISFTLKEANFVSVQITDLPGNVIADLIFDKFIEAGEQKIKFDSKNPTSGTYFCTIKAGNYTETVKFLVQK